MLTNMVSTGWFNHQLVAYFFTWISLLDDDENLKTAGDDWDGDQRMEGWGCGEWSELKVGVQ